MSYNNPGPSSSTTSNTTLPVTNYSLLETIKVNLGTIAQIGSATTSEITFSGLGTGIQAGDVILAVSKPTAQAGIGVAGWRVDASVNDKFYLTFTNPTAGGITPTASETYTITVARMSQSNTALSALV